jgi:hypothetical protein
MKICHVLQKLTITLALLLLIEDVRAQIISPPTTGDGASGDSFGMRVQACGDEMLIAATSDQIPGLSNQSADAIGSIYRYRLVDNQPSLIGKLEMPGRASSALFGISMVCDANELFVGAPGVASSNADTDAGTVFRYLRQGSNWQFNGEVPDARRVADARFGFSTALNANWLVVGAPGEGAAYAYARNGASLVAPIRLQPAGLLPTAAEANFGSKVAISANEVAVSAPLGVDGIVVRYALSNLAVESERLTGPRSFGSGIAFSETHLLIGAPFAQNGIGEVRAFPLASGNVQTLQAPRFGGSVEFFGEVIEVNANRIAISATGARLNRNNAEGALHVFDGELNLLRSLRPDALNNSARSDAFGQSVTWLGSNLFVGAPSAEAAGHPTQGQVSQFDAATFSAIAKVDSGRGAAFDRFGSAIALSGERAIVGAFLVDSSAGVETGEAYVYRRERGGWRLEATLTPPDALEEQRFGVAVDIDGDTAVVGSYWDVVSQTVDAGSVYVYRRSARGEWQFVQKLTSAEPRLRGFFGFSVAIDGPRIAVGSRGDSESFLDQGAAQFFLADSLGNYQGGPVIRLSTAQAQQFFGAAIDVKGDQALVGAPGTNANSLQSSGAMYLFQAAPESNDFALVNQFSDTTGSEGAGFGLSVSIANAVFYGGAPFQTQSTFSSVGRVLGFSSAGGAPTQIWSPSSPQNGLQFGTSIAARADGVWIGAPGLDQNGIIDVGGVFFGKFGGGVIAGLAGNALRTQLGRTIAVDQGLALSAAPRFFTVNPEEGRVYQVDGDDLFGDGFD